jgi:hypothetical protein
MEALRFGDRRYSIPDSSVLRRAKYLDTGSIRMRMDERGKVDQSG